MHFVPHFCCVARFRSNLQHNRMRCVIHGIRGELLVHRGMHKVYPNHVWCMWCNELVTTTCKHSCELRPVSLLTGTGTATDTGLCQWDDCWCHHCAGTDCLCWPLLACHSYHISHLLVMLVLVTVGRSCQVPPAPASYTYTNCTAWSYVGSGQTCAVACAPGFYSNSTLLVASCNASVWTSPTSLTSYHFHQSDAACGGYTAVCEPYVCTFLAPGLEAHAWVMIHHGS